MYSFKWTCSYYLITKIPSLVWVFDPNYISTNSTMLPLRSCRRSTESSLTWYHRRAPTVSYFGGQIQFYLYGCIINLLLLLMISAFTDSTQKDLLKLIGNLAVQYEGRCELWHQRLSMETIVHWWRLLCHKVAPTTSLFSSGCWTLSPSLLPYVYWDPRLTWLSGRASTWMLEDGSSCRDCKTGIT